MAITVVGSVALDSISSPAGSVERALGGSAVHFSNAASLTSKVNIVGVVGEDFPSEGLAFLHGKNVDTSGITVVPGGKTFFWKGRYEGSMNTAITEETQLNVFETFQPELLDHHKAAKFLFLANIHPSLQRYVLEQKGDGQFTILDSMNLWIDTTRSELETVITMVDGLILNDEEIRSVTGEQNVVKAAKGILERGPAYVIVKKGEHGVLALSRDWMIALPAMPLDAVVDPTGAGDSFAGALVGYLDSVQSMAHEDWKSALAYAACVASFNVENFSVTGIAETDVFAVKKRFIAYRSIFSIDETLKLT